MPPFIFRTAVRFLKYNCRKKTDNASILIKPTKDIKNPQGFLREGLFDTNLA